VFVISFHSDTLPIEDKVICNMVRIPLYYFSHVTVRILFWLVLFYLITCSFHLDQ